LRNIQQLLPQNNDFGNLSRASAETVENTVTQVIEQQMNGLDGLRYISFKVQVMVRPSI
jgi:hypothetical protein